MRLTELSEQTQRHADRIGKATDIGRPINASRMLADYGKDIEGFRVGFRSYDPVEAHSTDRHRAMATDCDGDIWITKRLAIELLQYCDVQFAVYVISILAGP
ncbi:hypothetical protein NHH03_22360 [Stieleria sp. TO1_6]|uniref:hypothetical protein n=1 Tax=Stieleria tagensis TaxID=2956795 RepID=UPI00209A7C47|nr:hypothetical protein [Stieleria tagensis]MCO8124499.1 hypothetical protein [Stieleria tagensis]